jgi:hypothetical protein
LKKSLKYSLLSLLICANFFTALSQMQFEKDITVDVKKKLVSLNLPAKSFILYRIKVLDK